MTRATLFRKMTISKGAHWCMFCDHEADFVITDHNGTTKEYSMCKECARLFNSKITEALNL